MTSSNKYILEAKGIKKHYGGVYALDDVSLQLRYNEILGLVGDNGAGKSTLIKIISGVLDKDEGEIYFDGKRVNVNSAIDARNLGIETVYQDLNLINNQNASFNIFLGRELTRKGILRFLVNKSLMFRQTTNLLDRLNVKIGNLKRPVSDYSGGQRQAIAISKAVYWGTKVVILDEPTAALGVNESRKTLELIKLLKQKSKISIIIISHNMQHIFSIVDRVMVLRRGKLVTVQNIHDVDSDDIVKYITGAEKIIERV